VIERMNKNSAKMMDFSILEFLGKILAGEKSNRYII